MKSFRLAMWMVLVLSTAAQAASFRVSEEASKKIDLAIEKAAQHAGPGRKITVFEVDQVLIEGSLRESFLYWMIKNNKILKPTNWSFASKWLTDAAIDILDDRCSLNSSSSLTLLTSVHPLCAQTIWWIYSQSQVPGHGDLKVWKRTDPDSMEKFRILWATQLQAGYSSKEIRDFARASLKEAKSASPSKTYKLGEAEVHPTLRLVPAVLNLIRKFESKGFEVWLTGSASQPVVEVFAEDIKIIKDRAIGLQAREDNKQRLLSRFESCASEREPVLNLFAGRRCWVQKKVFLEKSKSRLVDLSAPIDLYFGSPTSGDVLAKDARFLKAQVDLKAGTLQVD